MGSTAQNVENHVTLNNYTLDLGHVLYLHHSDSTNCSLSSEALTGNNYAQ